MADVNASQADYFIDRRSLRRKVTFWRVAAVLAALIAIGAVGWRIAGAGTSSISPHIARLSIEGVITGDKDTVKLIRDIGKSRAAAMIVSIESPGGTTTGAERIYDEIRLVAAKKPVVAVVGTMAASGGYIAALGADRIVAQGNSLVGSIGVLVQFPNVSKLLDTVGVKMEEVKSAPLKAAPNGFEPTSDAARAALDAIVQDSFVWFKDLVKARRTLSDQELATVSDGRVFTGRQGIALKLVDQLGGEREAIAWMESNRGIAANLPVRDWKASRSLERLGILGFAASVAEWTGAPGLARLLDRAGAQADSRLLDGVVAIWQADFAH